MRYKALAKRFKLAIDLEDSIPVAYALASANACGEVAGLAAQENPRTRRANSHSARLPAESATRRQK